MSFLEQKIIKKKRVDNTIKFVASNNKNYKLEII